MALVSGRKEEIIELNHNIEDIRSYQEYPVSDSALLDAIQADLNLIINEHKPTHVSDMLACLE